MECEEHDGLGQESPEDNNLDDNDVDSNDMEDDDQDNMVQKTKKTESFEGIMKTGTLHGILDPGKYVVWYTMLHWSQPCSNTRSNNLGCVWFRIVNLVALHNYWVQILSKRDICGLFDQFLVNKLAQLSLLVMIVKFRLHRSSALPFFFIGCHQQSVQYYSMLFNSQSSKPLDGTEDLTGGKLPFYMLTGCFPGC